MDIKLGFYGAAQNVTGSRYLLKANGANILVDCGLYQEHDLKSRNWESFPIPPKDIDAVILTHAHLDHCGLLPRLVAQGFKNKIYCTAATADIAKIVMTDCAKINLEDTRLKKERHQKEGRKAKFPELPIYTTADVMKTVPHFATVPFLKPKEIARGITAEFFQVGHILGAAFVRITVTDGDQTKRIIFSGDVGRSNMPILEDPEKLCDADYIVIESTYGDRTHGPTADIGQELADIVNDTVARGGNLIIPSFAIERTQELIYFLAKLLGENAIPHLRTFIDSPMAVQVSEIFKRHPYLFDQDTVALSRKVRLPSLTMVRTSADSKSLNHISGTAIIISGSGMCTGGRIKHHLIHNIENPANTILFVGYQASQTLGRQILDGNKNVRILGSQFAVRAKVAKISGFSAHADKNELAAWLSSMPTPPKQVFVTHGEPEAANCFADMLRTEKGMNVAVPAYKDEFVL